MWSSGSVHRGCTVGVVAVAGVDADGDAAVTVDEIAGVRKSRVGLLWSILVVGALEGCCSARTFDRVG